MADVMHTSNNVSTSAPLEVFLQRKNQIYGYIYGYVKDPMEADDLFQEMAVKIMRKVKNNRYREEGKTVQWVMRLVRNFLIDYYRRKKHRSVSALEPFHLYCHAQRSPEEVRMEEEKHHAIYEALSALPQEQSDVIRLRFFERKKFREIAELTHTNINTVLGRYRYGLNKMRRFLEGHPHFQEAIS